MILSAESAFVFDITRDILHLAHSHHFIFWRFTHRFLLGLINSQRISNPTIIFPSSIAYT